MAADASERERCAIITTPGRHYCSNGTARFLGGIQTYSISASVTRLKSNFLSTHKQRSRTVKCMTDSFKIIFCRYSINGGIIFLYLDKLKTFFLKSHYHINIKVCFWKIVSSMHPLFDLNLHLYLEVTIKRGIEEEHVLNRMICTVEFTSLSTMSCPCFINKDRSVLALTELITNQAYFTSVRLSLKTT